MISSLRDGIVKVKGLWKEDEEEEPSFFEEESQVSSKRSESRKRLIAFRAFQRLKEKVGNDYDRAENGDNSADMKAYRLGVVKQVQCIFGHLMKSRLQLYTPRNLWKSFRCEN